MTSMNPTKLTIEQRFALSRARYEVSRMSRTALEKTALRLLKSRMDWKNSLQLTLASNGILLKMEEQGGPMPEIISEETFMELLMMQEMEDEMTTDIHDEGWENEDLEDDGLTFI